MLKVYNQYSQQINNHRIQCFLMVILLINNVQGHGGQLEVREYNMCEAKFLSIVFNEFIVELQWTVV